MIDMPYLDSGQVEYINKALLEIQNDSDRAGAIIIGAELDSALYDVLNGFLLPQNKRSTPLVEIEGPLGTMAARIEASYRLGLISENMHKDLHYLRRIRNEFAHRPAGYSFQDSPVAEYCKELAIANWIIRGKPDLLTDIKGLASNRSRFTLSGIVCVTMLTGLPKKIQIVTVKDSEYDNGNEHLGKV